MLRGLWGRQSANKRLHFCRERIFTLFSGFLPTPHCHPTPPPGCGRKCCGRERWDAHPVAFFRTLACSEALNRHKNAFFEGYLTQRIYSADIFLGIANFWGFFYLRPFWLIGLWKKCGQIGPLPRGLGLSSNKTVRDFLADTHRCTKVGLVKASRSGPQWTGINHLKRKRTSSNYDVHTVKKSYYSNDGF